MLKLIVKRQLNKILAFIFYLVKGMVFMKILIFLFMLIFSNNCGASLCPEFKNLKKIRLINSEFQARKIEIQNNFVRFLINNNYEHVLKSLVCLQSMMDLNPNPIRTNIFVSENDITHLDIIYLMNMAYNVHPLKIALDLFKAGFWTAPKALHNYVYNPNKDKTKSLNVHQAIIEFTFKVNQRMLQITSYRELNEITHEFNFIVLYQALKNQAISIN